MCVCVCRYKCVLLCLSSTHKLRYFRVIALLFSSRHFMYYLTYTVTQQSRFTNSMSYILILRKIPKFTTMVNYILSIYLVYKPKYEILKQIKFTNHC